MPGIFFLARRNLTDEQRLLVLGRMYERKKKSREQNLKQAPKGQIDPSGIGRQEKMGQSDPFSTERTSKQIAIIAGVGEKTVRRAAEFAKFEAP
ncbi:MAG: hypothetical protein AB1796_09480 [Bacillota bacterium]